MVADLTQSAYGDFLVLVRLGHRPVVQGLVEDLLVDARPRARPPGATGRRRQLLDDLARAVVADVGVERGGRRERQLGVALAGLAVGLDPVDALLGEELEALASSFIDSSRFRASSGTKTLSSKWPCMPPTVIAASLPITWAATCVTTSGITGLTLPGMIELPFWSSGSAISARPARGPEPIKRMSLAIFVSDTATVFSAPDASTSASRAAVASERGRRGPGSAARLLAHRAHTRSANSGAC